MKDSRGHQVDIIFDNGEQVTKNNIPLGGEFLSLSECNGKTIYGILVDGRFTYCNGKLYDIGLLKRDTLALRLPLNLSCQRIYD